MPPGVLDNLLAGGEQFGQQSGLEGVPPEILSFFTQVSPEFVNRASEFLPALSGAVTEDPIGGLGVGEEDLLSRLLSAVEQPQVEGGSVGGGGGDILEEMIRRQQVQGAFSGGSPTQDLVRALLQLLNDPSTNANQLIPTRNIMGIR